MQKVICAVIEKEGALLLVQKRGIWILPGDKQKAGESERHCLLREIGEELPGFALREEALTPFCCVSGITPHSKHPVRVVVYLADGEGDISPACEIAAARWEHYPMLLPLSSITQKIVEFLHMTGHG